VKIWFQNRRSKFKKLVKQHGGLNQTAASLLSPSVNDTVPDDVCATPPSSSSSPPPPPSPPAPKSSHVDKQTRSTTAFPPEVDSGTEMASSFDHFTGVQHVDDLPELVSTQPAPTVRNWPPTVGTWRTDAVEASPYSCWPTYGIHSSATSSSLYHHSDRVWPLRSAEEQWAPMSGFDRRYGSGLVAAQPWYSVYAHNTRHTSSV